MRPLRGNTAVVLAALLAWASGPLPAAAQVIAGRVIDQRTRLPLQRISVQVLGDSAQVVAGVTTDTTGLFQANLAGAGTFRVRFAVDSAEAFESDTIRVGVEDVVQREFVVPLLRPYFGFEVESQVSIAPGHGVPKYPVQLKEQNVEGEVLAQFVVDSTGRFRAGSFRALRMSHPLFADAVREALPNMRFKPARIRGRKVAQMVQQPFTFSLAY